MDALTGFVILIGVSALCEIGLLLYDELKKDNGDKYDI